MGIFSIFKKDSGIVPITTGNALNTSLIIPEPTKSLLWSTSEDVSKARSSSSIHITITLTNEGVSSTLDDPEDKNNFYAEPSLIWTQLPIQPNSALETKPMYYPSYSSLSPVHRFQYLNWLVNVEQETNLSYVFLYYYGLERHLLIGNYDGAVDEILRLLRYHDKGTFRSYATTALLVASLERKRTDIFEKAPFLFEQLSNEGILLRFMMGKNLVAKEVMELASQVGFKNKRYIKMYPKEFAKILQQKINKVELTEENRLTIDSLEVQESTAFANLSIPDQVRRIRIPQILYDERFKKNLNQLLTETHATLKEFKNSRHFKPGPSNKN